MQRPTLWAICGDRSVLIVLEYLAFKLMGEEHKLSCLAKRKSSAVNNVLYKGRISIKALIMSVAITWKHLDSEIGQLHEQDTR